MNALKRFSSSKHKSLVLANQTVERGPTGDGNNRLLLGTRDLKSLPQLNDYS